MQTKLYINNELNTDLTVRSIRASYVRPWEAELYFPGRHDMAPSEPMLWDFVRIEDTSSNVLFRGNVIEVTPGGVAGEGVTYLAQCKRFRLENEPVRVNGRGHYVWNRRGHPCSEGKGGEDSPGKDGGKWTCGEIIIDILEHALGLPGGGSDIGGHHSDSSCVTNTYLGSGDVAGYTAATILTLNSICGEFSVENTPVAQAISMLLALNGGFWGWYLDPDTNNLVVRDLDTLATTDIQAGVLGTWQDAGGTDYRLLDNELTWSLDGVCSRIRIQGVDGTAEEQPSNIEGDGNPGKGDKGELELVAAPWRDYPAGYRAVAQPKRRFCGKEIDPANDYTPPQGYANYSHWPRVYKGTDAGAKYVYTPSSGELPHWLEPCGIVAFNEAPSLGGGEKLWGWYWTRTPFVVEVGPDGDAYDCFGYERTRTVYDPAFRHTTSWPQPGTADDETAMQTLGTRLLRLYKDVRRQGALACDRVDFTAFSLDKRYNVVNLGPTTTTSIPGCDNPMDWSQLHVNAVDVLYDFERDLTEITVANTFFMLEGYSALKERLELNLFAQRELALSEGIYACQVRAPVHYDSGDENEPTTTTTTTTSTTTTTTCFFSISDNFNRADTSPGNPDALGANWLLTQKKFHVSSARAAVDGGGAESANTDWARHMYAVCTNDHYASFTGSTSRISAQHDAWKLFFQVYCRLGWNPTQWYMGRCRLSEGPAITIYKYNWVTIASANNQGGDGLQKLTVNGTSITFQSASSSLNTTDSDYSGMRRVQIALAVENCNGEITADDFSAVDI